MSINSLPTDDAARNLYPMADGCLDYFPNALAEVARISYIGNQKHNPGEPMHWARGKSTDHRNKIVRHCVDAAPDTEDAIEHAAACAWRALAELQEKLERVRGYPVPAGASPIAPATEPVDNEWQPRETAPRGCWIEVEYYPWENFATPAKVQTVRSRGSGWELKDESGSAYFHGRWRYPALQKEVEK